MPTKIKPFIVTFKTDDDVEETMRHMAAISNSGSPVDMTQVNDSTWSMMAPGLRLLTVGSSIFIRLYHGTMRVLTKQVEDVEDAQGRSIKKLLS